MTDALPDLVKEEATKRIPPRFTPRKSPVCPASDGAHTSSGWAVDGGMID